MSRTPRVDRERLATTIEGACCQSRDRAATGYYVGTVSLVGATAYLRGAGVYIVMLGPIFALEDSKCWELGALPPYVVEHLVKLIWEPNDPVSSLQALAYVADND